ncbi:MAG: ribosomal protein methyltransferase [Acidobacteriota bacterium]|nr:ribosomal protein methyltransferase [Acidobacteriota bacterium]
MKQEPRIWHAIDVTLEPTAREALEYALMEAGSLGTEVSDENLEALRVTAYFDSPPERESVRATLLDALRVYDLPSSSVRSLDLREVADRDWLGEWKKSWQPVPVGKRFLIAPPWSEVSGSDDRICIRIEPGMAFGTGTHETTRLCLTAMEKYFSGGSFLDVGTGTGILAIAAAKLHPDANIEACDTDPDAVEIATENARLNGVADRVSFRAGTVEATTASANVVCANLTANVILPLLPSLIGATCGRLILSGILDTQVEAVLVRLRELGLAEVAEVLIDGEWVAVII